jgi:hypothetical protein
MSHGPFRGMIFKQYLIWLKNRMILGRVPYQLAVR